ncbi:kinase-like protein [Marasmius fiardii PR-910]|nr:kinase-like protein [Marasmius fiardii PR-910]
MNSSKPLYKETGSARSDLSSESDSDGELWIRPPQATTTDVPTSRTPPRRSTSVFRRTAADSEWATRPGYEDLYEQLETLFPDHDLDKPISEGSEESENAGPTTTEVTAHTRRIAQRKSIRTLAKEYKKNLTSDTVETSPIHSRAKHTGKLWGSKLEGQVTKWRAGVFNPLPLDSPHKPPVNFKWVRGELIGRGTYDRVYLALNTSTGGMMAVKQVELPTAVNREQARQTSFLQALKREMETLEYLDHPNIVKYLGFEETSSILSIFLEYVPGGSIGEVLRKHGKLKDEITVFFTRQILEGLEYLHSQGIIHRNLTSDNILLETNGTCKISDFGLSRRTTDPESENPKLYGAVFWMAPELLASQKNHSSKADIWSIGCLFLEMVSGKRPWAGENTFAVMFQIYQKKLPPPVPEGTELSRLAENFKRQCFAINSEERPSAEELLKHEYLELSPSWQFTGLA